jgi:hypothetical protein
VTLGQFRALSPVNDQLVLVTPDVVQTFRTMTNEGPAAVIKAIGVPNLMKGAMGVQPARALTDTGRLWQGFAALLRAELAAVPRDHDGLVALDGYLVDLAAATGRLDEVAGLVGTLRRSLPRAIIGIETNSPDLGRLAVPLAREDVGFVMALGAPDYDVVSLMRDAVDDPHMPVYVKTGPQPPEVLRWALRNSSAWVSDPSRLVVDWKGVDDLGSANAELFVRAMAGTGCPDWAVTEASELLGVDTHRESGLR